MKKKKELLALAHILQKVAPRIGARVLMEPQWEMVGQITFKSGRCSYFKYNTLALDLNPIGGSEVARDKDYANFFMKTMGYSIVPGSKTFFSNQWAQATRSPHRDIDAGYIHAQKLGFPVIVKPNNGSQGAGVSLVHTKQEFYACARAIFKQNRIILVQRPVTGKDYRILVLDKKIISAYERIPLNIVGDGKSTIEKLFKIKQKECLVSGRHMHIKINDPRIALKLKHQRFNLKTILTKGQKVFLLDNANLSTGGDLVDVTQKVHPEFKKLAIKLTPRYGSASVRC